MVMIEIKNVTKTYGSIIALKDISVSLGTGIYGLLGPNGAGKTTLIRIMVDLARPSSGNILYNGEEISSMGERFRNILGYLPQNFNAYSNFTAIDFLRYIASLKGLPNSEAKRRSYELLNLVGLSEYAKKKLGGFSGGMRQRVGIAQAMLNNPQVLILDEPTAGLDPKERIRFRSLISDLSKDKTVLLSTHIVSDIEYAAEKVLLLKAGELIQYASPSQLLAVMQEKVWQYETDDIGYEKLRGKELISNVVRNEKVVTVRIVADNKPMEGAQPASPRIEDLYMYYFGESQEA